MEKLTTRQQTILDVVDEQIKELEDKLQKIQPLIDELAKLKRTRQVLLSERSVTGGVRSGVRITMEQVIHALREREGSSNVTDLASDLGVDPTVIRSHLNRYRDERYARGDNGDWTLIGTEGE